MKVPTDPIVEETAERHVPLPSPGAFDGSIEAGRTAGPRTRRKRQGKESRRRTDENDRRREPTTTDSSSFHVYRSACVEDYSNDEFTVDSINGMPLCNATFFGGCDYPSEDSVPNADTNGPVVPFTIPYAYELYYLKGADPIRAVNFVETLVVQNIADLAGVKECTTEDSSAATAELSYAVQQQQQGGKDDPYSVVPETSASIDEATGLGQRSMRQRGLEGTFLSQTQTDRIVAVSSDPADQIDPDFDCAIPVPASIRDGTLCRPIAGTIRLYVDRDSPFALNSQSGWLSIKSGVMRYIRLGMDEQVYSGGNVRYTNFIGTRVNDDGDTGSDLDGLVTENRDITTGDGSSGSITDGQRSIAVASGTIGLLVLCVLFLAAKRRRKSYMSDYSDAGFGDNVHINEEETSAYTLDNALDPPGAYTNSPFEVNPGPDLAKPSRTSPPSSFAYLSRQANANTGDHSVRGANVGMKDSMAAPFADEPGRPNLATVKPNVGAVADFLDLEDSGPIKTLSVTEDEADGDDVHSFSTDSVDVQTYVDFSNVPNNYFTRKVS